MASANQAQEQTMEEILASIRRMISDDDGSAAAAQPDARVQPQPQPLRSSRKISRLFAENGRPETDGVSPPAADNVVELAIAQAMEDAREEVAAEAAEAAASPAAALAEARPAPIAEVAARAAPPEAEVPGIDEARGQPLLSPHADVAVAGAFNRLAATMLSRSDRTIDELVEDLLRPLLRNWLDANLPPMVERLVREEIERVARGRR